MLLYLIRHGESIGNQKRLIFGSSDYPLTDAGRADAELVANKIRDIPITCCYASPLIRAYETAEICFKGRDVPIIKDESFMEQFMGDFEDGEFEFLMEKYPVEFGGMMSDWTVNPPVGGESFDHMYDRVTRSVDRIISLGEDAAIVAHNGSLSIAASYLLGGGKRCAETYYHRHGCYTSIIIGSSFRQDLNVLEYFNK